MRKLSLVVMAALVVFSSCRKVVGEGPVVSEIRNVSDFTGIDLRAPVQLVFKQNAQYKLEVSAQQNILDILETYKSGNGLVIRIEKDKIIKSHEPIVVTVHAPTINSMEVSGSGTIQSTETIQAAEMDLDVNGSGRILLSELITTPLNAHISGSGRITIDGGTAMYADLHISGSGKIDAGNITATTATTKTSGSGDMWVHATQALNVNISGSGRVYYKGNPQLNLSISGSGKVLPY